MPVSKQTEVVTPQAGGWVAAALVIASGGTASAAAAASGVCLRTIRRWSKKPAFQKLVEEIRAELISATLGKLLAANAAAVDALSSLLNDPQGSVKLGAASRLLELTLKARRQLDTERELEDFRDRWEQFQDEHPELFGAGQGSSRSSN